MSMVLVETVTVGSSGASSIQFNNIPQTGTDLLLVISGRSNGGNAMYMSLNNNNSVTRTYRVLEGSGSTVVGTGGTGLPDLGIYLHEGQNATTTANVFGNSQVYIADYRSSTNKVLSMDTVTENNATVAYTSIMSGLYGLTSSVNSILIRYGGTNKFEQHSLASLYMITKA